MSILNGKTSLLRLINGFLIISSVILSRIHNPNWLYFTGLIGVMLIIAGLTGFCFMEKLLMALGVKETGSCQNNIKGYRHDQK